MTDIRPAERGELEAVVRAMSGPFGFDLPDEGDERVAFLDRIGATFEEDRARLAVDDGRIVGTLGTFSLGMSVPGGSLPMAGTTWVTVATTHRRRGILRQLIRSHLEDARDREEPAAALWASDSAIYGRFGYGLAAHETEVEIDRRHVDLHRLAATPATVSECDVEEVAAPARQVYGDVFARVPGMLERSETWWEHRILADRPENRRGATKARYAVAWEGERPVAWAKYRLKSIDEVDAHPAQDVVVSQLFASTPSGWAGIWRHVMSHDFGHVIRAEHRPVDDPIHSLLAGPRRARTRTFDALWVRVLDVARFLEGRSYLHDDSVSFTVTDGDGLSDGRYALEVADGVGRVSPTPADTEITLDIEDLGALSMGGRSAVELQRAGRITGDDPAIRRVDRLFRWDHAPWCPEVF